MSEYMTHIDAAYVNMVGQDYFSSTLDNLTASTTGGINLYNFKIGQQHDQLVIDLNLYGPNMYAHNCNQKYNNLLRIVLFDQSGNYLNYIWSNDQIGNFGLWLNDVHAGVYHIQILTDFHNDSDLKYNVRVYAKEETEILNGQYVPSSDSDVETTCSVTHSCSTAIDRLYNS